MEVNQENGLGFTKDRHGDKAKLMDDEINKIFSDFDSKGMKPPLASFLTTKSSGYGLDPIFKKDKRRRNDLSLPDERATSSTSDRATPGPISARDIDVETRSPSANSGSLISTSHGGTHSGKDVDPMFTYRRANTPRIAINDEFF